MRFTKPGFRHALVRFTKLRSSRKNFPFALIWRNQLILMMNFNKIFHVFNSNWRMCVGN
jgi:hypothetical protein